MAKSVKKPGDTLPPVEVPGPIEAIPIIPKDPCTVAASQMEKILSDQCSRKFHKMKPGCCCKLSEEEQSLVQIHSNADVAMLNTASNGAGGVLPGGSNDSSWQVGTALGGPFSTAFVANSKPSTWGPTPPATNAEWISQTPGAQAPGDTSTFYRLRFVLCEDIDPSKFELMMSLLVDNQLGNLPTADEIWVNGVVQTGIPSVGFIGKPVLVSLKNNWKTCVNEIKIHVRNTQGAAVGNWTGLFAQFATISIPPQSEEPCTKCECRPLEVPKVKPQFCVSWGDSDCDCFETNDCEVVCITACNCYSNISFEDLTLGPITVLDQFGQPVPTLPDGSPSVVAIPIGPVCFGDLGPCTQGRPTCKSRQFVIKTCGAKPGKYQLSFGTICYKICYSNSAEACFEFTLCKD